ncbi:hypothetical protein EW145_g8230, partial [Phellinidium pouzarii]
MEHNLLLSSPLPLAFRITDDRLHSSLPSPPSSPLMLSPTSPTQSPRMFRSSPSALSRSIALAHAQHFDPYTTFASHPSAAAAILATSPGSATSSDESRSPLENPLDVDFDSMADFEYAYPLSFSAVAGARYGGEPFDHAQASPSDRKHHPIDITPADGEGISVGSPYMFSGGDLPFLSGHLKQEYYPPNVSDMANGGSYAYMGVPSPEHPSAQHAYTYSSSPESPFLDANAYYSPPVSTAMPIAPGYPHNAHLTASSVSAGGSASRAAAAGQGGCDPRFVSVSPPQLGIGSRMVSARAGGLGSATSSYPAVRFAGAFASPDADADADADGAGEADADGEIMHAYDRECDEDESGEDEREDEDNGNDSDYVDVRARPFGGRRPHASLVVPSQAARVSALTTPVVGSSVSPTSPSPSASASPTHHRSPARHAAATASLHAQRAAAPAPIPVPNLTK